MNVMEEKIDFRGEFDTYGASGIIVLACSEKSRDEKNNKLKKNNLIRSVYGFGLVGCWVWMKLYFRT